MLQTWFADCFRPCLLVGASLLMLPLALVFAEPPKPALTPAQQEKLKEGNRLLSEANRLQREGKLAAAIAAAEKMLAIERQVFGDVNADVAESWEWLAEMHQQRENFGSARKARQQVPSCPATRRTPICWKRWRSPSCPCRNFCPNC
jgi:hypothetical protein